LLASVRPRDLTGRIHRAVAAELITEVETLDSKLKALKRRLAEAVTAAGSGLMDIYGVGPAGSWLTLVTWPGSPTATTSPPGPAWTGTAPIDASSGEQIRHRLSRAGNRRLNHVHYIAATSPRSARSVTTPPAASTTSGSWPRGRRRWRPCAACAGHCPMSSTGSWSPTP
jgi:transposase